MNRPVGETPAARRGVLILAEQAQWAVGIVGGILGLLFTWLTFKGHPYVQWIEKADTEFIRHVTLAFYYFCWIFGCTFDIRMQREVYRSDPLLGSLPRMAVGAILLLLVIAAALLAASESDEWFAALLVVFVATNILGWRIVLRRVRPIIADSERQYILDENFFGVEQLRVVVAYIDGAWQRRRFALMIVLILMANAICFIPLVKDSLSQILARHLGNLSPAAVSRLLPVASLMMFVVSAEGWVWIRRVRARATLSVLYALQERYKLQPAPPQQ